MHVVKTKCPQTSAGACISKCSLAVSPVLLLFICSIVYLWTAARQASLSWRKQWITSQTLLKLISSESVMPFNHIIPCHPLLLLPSFLPSIEVFSSELALCMRWQKYWSFGLSISPSNEYPGLTSFMIDWFDLPAVRDSQESSPAPLFESINSSALSFLYGSTLTSVHDYWKNHSFDYTDLCWRSDVSAL